MKAFIWRYVPYLVAAFMVANGFYTLAMGLGEIFHLDQYLAVELGEMRRYWYPPRSWVVSWRFSWALYSSF